MTVSFHNEPIIGYRYAAPGNRRTIDGKESDQMTQVPPPASGKTKDRKPVSAPAEARTPRLFSGITIILLVCICMTFVVLSMPLWMPYFNPAATPTPAPSDTATVPLLSVPPATTAPTSAPTEIPQPSATFTPLVPQTTGPWNGQVSQLELIVERVEITDQSGDTKLLRFYVTVDNQSSYSITMPLSGNFLAIDSKDRSYNANLQTSDWPNTFPGLRTIKGFIDLQEPVPSDITVMSVRLSKINGPAAYIGKSIAVSDIEVP